MDNTAAADGNFVLGCTVGSAQGLKLAVFLLLHAPHIHSFRLRGSFLPWKKSIESKKYAQILVNTRRWVSSYLSRSPSKNSRALIKAMFM
jgi:hypothetical protein